MVLEEKKTKRKMALSKVLFLVRDRERERQASERKRFLSHSSTPLSLSSIHLSPH
jgi:hypothetical protein